MEKTEQKKITNSDYEALISKSLEKKSIREKTIVNGNVISFENDIVTIDVGLKSEGRIPLSEFTRPGQKPEISVGDKFEVYVENIDNSNGETVLSREKAVKQKAWNTLQDSFENNKVVTGTPFNRVKGGMSVDLNGVVAFLPGSQIDTRQILKDTKELLNKPLDLMILKMDKFRGNIVVSRKAISEVELKEQRKELLSTINEGSIIEGKVKNLTDYGAFIDLGGMDGLVHITDISWTKINNPADILTLGQDIKVKVLKFDEELSRLSLGIKQLQENPWDNLEENISIDNIVSAKINSINDTTKFTQDSIKLVYSLGLNSFTLISDNKNNVYLVKVKNIYEKNLDKNNLETKEFINQTNINLRENLYNSYDFLLNEKYKITINENTLERMKNYFR